ncbi:MAG TPA: AMP-binding protein, partial [Pyrinomonadaceae bacterium]|nr:AMP-binding protein [Pyrinomonadaceae bacterium]
MSSITSTDELSPLERESEPSTLVQLLRRRATLQTDQPAHTFLVDGATAELHLTYGELDRQARAIAASLQQFVSSGDRVLLLYPAGLEFIAAFYGCLYAGAVAVPAYPPRRNRSLLRLQSIVADAQATVALTTAATLAKVVPLFSVNPYLPPLRWLATEEIAADAGGDWQEPAIAADSLAFLQYTSGSTGLPKGVMLTHENLLTNAALVYQAVGHTPEDSYVSWLPTFHDMGFMAGILQPLYGGFPSTLMSPAAFLQKPLRWLEAISRTRATTSGAPNFAYDLCVRKTTAEERAQLDLSRWSVAFNGAEPIRHETIERFAAAFAESGFRREVFYPCYGLAEATLMAAGGRKSLPPVIKTVAADALENHQARFTSPDDEGAHALVGCGQTMPGQRLKIVDQESLTERLPGEVGEIWVSGASVARGYWGRPEETAATFQAHLADTGEGAFLRTGDLGFLHEGELFVTGRLKDLIVIRGLNHYPQDIELTVEQAHPSLRPGCGAAFSVDVAGEERLVVVQEADHHERDLAAVVGQIRQAVAEEHELQVYAVVLIKKNTLPKTSSGKIQRHAARNKFLEKSFDALSEWRANMQTGGDGSGTSSSAFVSAALSAEAVEEWLVSQLAERLGVAPAELDVNQPLTRYNLDSLTATELTYSIETGLGTTLPMASFLQDFTIAQLATQALNYLSSAPPAKASGGEPAGAVAECPLSRGQQALWFLQQLAPESAAYNLATAARVWSEVDSAALRRAFQALVDRHPSLRTTFASSEQGPVQRIGEHGEISFYEHDGAEWSEEDLHNALILESHRPFNLEEGPLLRVTLIRRDAQKQHILLLVAHHIISDFWSLAVLIDELGKLYQSERDATAVALAPLPLRYADYVNWQEGLLLDREGDALWSYWQAQLSGELPVLDLHTDHARPPVQTFRGTSHSFKLSADLTAKLKSLGQSHGATLYMTLLAAYQVVLHRHTGQEDILVGSPTSGRRWAEVAGIVGYFVNPVVLRASLKGNPTFEEFLSRTRRTVLDAFMHQDYPIALLVERLQPERDASRSPLFQTMFTLQKSHLRSEGKLDSFALGETGTRINIGGLELESLALEQRVSQFDLNLSMAEVDGGLSASLQYNTDLFDAATIARIATHFETLLEEITTDATKRIAELRILSPAEIEQLRSEWNATELELPADLCLHELFEAQVERTPTAEALVCGASRLTYAELNERANRLARHLRTLGVGAETLVGICLDRSVELVVALLGVLKAGGAYVPLDPQYPRERLRLMVEDSGASVLVTTTRWRDLFTTAAAPAGSAHSEDPAASATTAQRAVVCVDKEAEEIARHSGKNVHSEVTSANLAYVIYTSGSTGVPKGVMITHRNLINFCAAMDERLDATLPATWLSLTSVSFDISALELFWTLGRGFRVVLERHPHLSLSASSSPSPALSSSASPSPSTPTPARQRATEFSLFYFSSDGARAASADTTPA